MVDALILDLGNVLIFHDNEKLFREMSRVFGVSTEALHQRIGTQFWPEVNRGQFRDDALRTELIKRLGGELSAERWFQTWNCHFDVNTEMVNAVAGLVGKVKLVLLSNTHDLHVKFIREKIPLLEKFDGLVLSCEVGLVKPDPEIYRQAIALTGVPASSAIFFDDVEAYVHGAKAVGLNAHVFTTVDQFRRDCSAYGLVVS